jgi:Asp-tRNA(Asn)/Glu-tRNA(Gln) amidotransferase A subunit family amidase
MARTVEDAVRVLQVIVGEDPEDPVTAAARGHPLPDYLASLTGQSEKRARVGILRQAYARNSADVEVLGVFEKAIDEMRASCAEVVGEVVIAAMERPQAATTCRGFRHDLDEYLATRGQRAPVHSLKEIFASGRFSPTIRTRIERALNARSDGPHSDACKAEIAYRHAFAAALGKAMDAEQLDALLYPTWSNPPRLIGDLTSPHGDNSQIFAPSSGFPAINVPMGYTRNGRLPAGLTLLGRAWDEATLIRLASCYELASKHRRPPPSTPPLD